MPASAQFEEGQRPFWRRHIVGAIAITAFMTVGGIAVAAASSGGPTRMAQPSAVSAPRQWGPAQSGAVAVAIQDFAFTPAALTVKVGSTVTWTNVDSEAHTVRTTADDTIHSGVLDTTATFAMTFQQPGTYAYHCSIHPEMQATITVVN